MGLSSAQPSKKAVRRRPLRPRPAVRAAPATSVKIDGDHFYFSPAVARLVAQWRYNHRDNTLFITQLKEEGDGDYSDLMMKPGLVAKRKNEKLREYIRSIS